MARRAGIGQSVFERGRKVPEQVFARRMYIFQLGTENVEFKRDEASPVAAAAADMIRAGVKLFSVCVHFESHSYAE